MADKPMTVAMVIAKLQELPQDAVCMSWEHQADDFVPIVLVEYNPNEAEPYVRMITQYDLDV